MIILTETIKSGTNDICWMIVAAALSIATAIILSGRK
jgi:hypothetical protein